MKTLYYITAIFAGLLAIATLNNICGLVLQATETDGMVSIVTAAFTVVCGVGSYNFGKVAADCLKKSIDAEFKQTTK